MCPLSSTPPAADDTDGRAADGTDGHCGSLYRWTLLSGAALLALPAFTLVAGVAGWAAGLPVGAYTLPAGGLLTIAFVVFAASRWLPPRSLALAGGALAFAGAALLVSTLVSWSVWDTTWDGQWFHQEAVLQLVEGWNPLRGPIGADSVPGSGARARINGYPAASWTYGAALVAATGRLESGKAFSPVLILGAFFLTAAALRHLSGRWSWVAWASSGLLALNPVALTQALNFQHDGDLVSVLLAGTAAVVVTVRSGSAIGRGCLGLAAILLAGLKFTGPVFLLLLIAALLTSDGLLRRRWPRGKVLSAALAAVLCAVVFNVHPYVTNVLRFEHPLYPYAGPHRHQVHDTDESGLLVTYPVERVESPWMARPTELLLSIFSRSSHAPNSIQAYNALMRGERMKVPFLANAAEFRVFNLPDVRIGGWGPLFGGMMLASLLLLLLTALGVRSPTFRWIVLVQGFLLLSALVVPEPWFARYAPQVWWLPLVIAAAARPRGLLARTAQVIVLALGFVNIGGILSTHVRATWHNSQAVQDRLVDLNQSRDTLLVHLSPFRSFRVRLEELGIRFDEVPHRGSSLGVVLGYFAPSVQSHELVQHADGGTSAVLTWLRLAHADSYQVRVVQPPPHGPGGGALTVVEREVGGGLVEVPVPVGTVHLLLTACNALGCGPDQVVATYDVPPPGPRKPIFGSPPPGTDVQPTGILFSWIPMADPATYRLRVRPATGGPAVLDVTTDDHFWATDLPTNMELSATVTATSGSEDLGSDDLRFRTSGPSVPSPTTPALDSTLSEGEVAIGWTEVPGATLYDYFVAVRGEPDSRVRGQTAAETVKVELEALEDEPTIYSLTVRACLKHRCDRERDWGPWSIEGGTGVTNFTVVPASQ